MTGVKEWEVEVKDFQEMHAILNELGFVHKAYQENRRIHYSLHGVEVDIDFWPMLTPYIEVEGGSPQEVERVVNLLGYTMDQTTTKNTDELYADEGIDIYSFKELKFEQ
jgi:adenylate cyclase class 2